MKKANKQETPFTSQLSYEAVNLFAYLTRAPAACHPTLRHVSRIPFVWGPLTEDPVNKAGRRQESQLYKLWHKEKASVIFSHIFTNMMLVYPRFPGDQITLRAPEHHRRGDRGRARAPVRSPSPPCSSDFTGDQSGASAAKSRGPSATQPGEIVATPLSIFARTGLTPPSRLPPGAKW